MLAGGFRIGLLTFDFEDWFNSLSLLGLNFETSVLVCVTVFLILFNYSQGNYQLFTLTLL